MKPSLYPNRVLAETKHLHGHILDNSLPQYVRYLERVSFFSVPMSTSYFCGHLID